MTKRHMLLGMILAAASLLFAGCASLGPDSVIRDRFGYMATISDSWESQMLLNLVKARYGHAPVFLDVTSVISQYALQTQAYVGASFQSPLTNRFTGDGNVNTLSLGGMGSYTDRPTITYSPLTGEKFARSLLAPIPPASMLNLVQAGYRVDLLFRLCVVSINGIRNSFGGPAAGHEADVRFYSLMEKMKRLQEAGDIGIKIQRRGEKQVPHIALRLMDNEATDPDKADVIKLLGLDATSKEFKVVYGVIPSDNKEIAIQSRSMLQMIMDLASTIDVPEKHVVEKRVTPTFKEKSPYGKPFRPLVQIQSSPQRPNDAFVVVPFRGYWFWIDDRDVMSKNLFSFLMFILTLTETGEKEGVPIVTIPAG